MKNVEQSDSVEHQQVTTPIDSSETQRLPAHKNLPTPATDIQAANPPTVIEKGKKGAKKENVRPSSLDLSLSDEIYKGLYISPNVKPLLYTDNPTSDHTVAFVIAYP